ncbi:MAG: hypothetical protein QOE05_3326 [Actinomycetota bacterium]|nr:hypothetical protein [Actinomycetota bacterium]
MTTITYGHWRAGLSGFPATLRQLIADHEPASICDVGGGASAALTVDEVQELRVRYTLLDISKRELEKSPGAYHKVEADIASPDLAQTLADRFDLMHSRMVAEHVEHPESMHQNVFDLLNPGGHAIHLMPTLWDPAFVLNWLLPERLAGKVLAKLQPTRRLRRDQAKFPAYYRWCRGPSRRQIRRIEAIGYEVVAVSAYFGTGYAMRIPVLNKLVELWIKALLKHPLPALTSYCIVVLRRPTTGA